VPPKAMDMGIDMRLKQSTPEEDAALSIMSLIEAMHVKAKIKTLYLGS
jgi:hypothetical protein